MLGALAGVECIAAWASCRFMYFYTSMQLLRPAQVEGQDDQCGASGGCDVALEWLPKESWRG